MSEHSHSARLSRSIVAVMATATGLAVASNYYAQPLLDTIARQFDMSSTAAGTLITAGQAGYAIGLMLLVPLGDLFEKRRLIVLMTVLSAIGLVISGAAPTVWVLFAGTALTGLFVVVAQLLVPFAATLAADHERGRVVGTVMSGLLIGILLARTAAGALALVGGWRTIYFVAAGLMLICALVLWRMLPRHHSHAGMRYPRLLLSVLKLFVEEPLLRARAAIGGLLFAAFSVLWTSLAFLLARPPYHYHDSVIGLFGLVGAAGALAASAAGRLADHGRTRWSTLIGLALLALSWVAIDMGSHSLAALIIGIVVLDLAVQGVHVTNQGLIYSLDARARNRLTSAYMTCYFLGGAFGSLVSGMAFSWAGWRGVCLTGGAISVAALVLGLLFGQSGAPKKDGH
ncbi:MFS transporter [Oleiagrimonas sp. C23AA]|uniref:MFS transporter n=1 Tax=Oleiagrimonas sp. C23AA TaxID=2719047 RepID=UPI00141F2E04|nr:MFS transporter [Oleiagrimonas sp. C23AA]NII09955.1 MFS transporter [Oleiagrimonas sp. C23AA]